MRQDAFWPLEERWDDPWAHEGAPEAVRAVWEGRAEGLVSRLEALAAGPDSLRPVLYPHAEAVLTGAEAAQLAADVEPALGMDGPHWVLGPWMEELDARDPWHRRAMVHAMGELAFALDRTGDPSPATQWMTIKPVPTVQERARVRALDRAPLLLWALGERVDAARWRLRPRVDLGPTLCPEEPVRLEPIGGVLGPVTTGDSLLARVAWDAAGPVAVLGLGLPGQPDDVLVRRWVHLIAAAWRASDPRAPLAECLRYRGFDLARAVHEWAWVRTHR
ncbi:MAG: hypothetical protein JXX28_01875 [Deltaproteobacteria bacterium]|nr:hypothetical protein [Deltaproteobacteria bacterium]